MATVSGGDVIFSPSIAHHPYYLYQWEIWGGPEPSFSDHTTIDVYKPAKWCYYV